MDGSLRAVRTHWAVSGRRGIGAIEASGASIAESIAFSRGVVTGSAGSVFSGAIYTVGGDRAGNRCISLSTVRASRALVAFGGTSEIGIGSSLALGVRSGSSRAVRTSRASDSRVSLSAV